MSYRRSRTARTESLDIQPSLDASENTQRNRLMCHLHDPPAVCAWQGTSRTFQVIDQVFECTNPACKKRYVVSYAEQPGEAVHALGA